MKSIITLALGLILSASVAFGSTACPQHFVDGQAPELITSLLPKTKALCYSEFAVLHSGVTRTPLYASELINPLRLQQADLVARVDAFHAERLLPLSERAELADYRNSGYDRGHMAPTADFGTDQAQYECFTLANMVPQNPNNNRGLWSQIEDAVRDYVRATNHNVFVVTGPVYDANPLMLNGRVAIPSKIFKAIYDHTTNQTGVYLVDNKSGIAYRTITVTELKVLIGIDVFPSLPIAVKGAAMVLPKPY